MRTHVSFQRPSTTLDGEPPFGGDIAHALAPSFETQGIHTTNMDSLDYAYFFYAPSDTRRCYVMIGLVDDGVRQWLISVDVKRGLLARLFGKPDTDSVRTVVDAIHHFLSADEAVSSNRWYTADDWNHRREDAWVTAPGA
jgi:hypothetical protein